MRLPLALSLSVCGLLAATGVLQSGCGGGNGGGATVGPTGDVVVFQSNRDGQFEVYVMNGDGSGQTRLTNNQVVDQDPTWSPDRSKIAYTSRIGAQSGSLEIMIMNADGSGLRRLTNNNFGNEQPAFSPDGTKIVFRSIRPDIDDAGRPFSNSDIYIINADGSGEQRLTTNAGRDLEPAFTPDGRILYSQEIPGIVSGKFRIVRINSDGSGFTPLTAGPNDAQPSASRGGSRIVFVAQPDRNTDIFMANADGSNRTRLTTTPGNELTPVFSPDGRRIYFTNTVNSNTDIYVMNADGSNVNNPVRLTTHPQADTVSDVR